MGRRDEEIDRLVTSSGSVMQVGGAGQGEEGGREGGKAVGREGERDRRGSDTVCKITRL